MGVRLVRCDSYKLKSRAGERIFLKGVDVHDLSEQDETFCLKLGYFHFVPTPNKEIPSDIKQTDTNIDLFKKGVIDKSGRLITKNTVFYKNQAVDRPLPEPEPIALKDRQVFDVTEDGTGKPVFVTPGSSCLEDLVEPSATPVKANKFNKN